MLRPSNHLRFLAVTLLAACQSSPPAATNNPNPRPRPTVDAGVPTTDASSADGGGTTQPDAAEGHFDYRCEAAPDLVDTVAVDPRLNASSISLVARADEFALAWSELRAATPDLFVSTWTGAGDDRVERPLVMASALERDPVLLASGETWYALYVDNAGETGYELRLARFDAAFQALGEVVSLTDTAGAVEMTPTAMIADDLLVAAWLEEDVFSLNRRVIVGTYQFTGIMTGSAQPLALASTPQAMELFRVNETNALVYVTREDGALYLRTLSGDEVGSERRLDHEGGADGSLDFATGSYGGAFVFGVRAGARPQVRFVTVGVDNQPGDERVLFDGATSPSIVSFAGGYAVAYHATETHEVRLALISLTGAVLQSITLAGSDEPGTVQLTVSQDGQLSVAWTDRVEAATRIRAAVVPCEEIR